MQGMVKMLHHSERTGQIITQGFCLADLASLGQLLFWFMFGINVYAVFLIEIRTIGRQENSRLTAENGTDFIFQNARLIFPAGEQQQSHRIDLAYGVDVDTEEHFEVCLTSPMSGSIESPECALIYIQNDDCKCTFYLFIYSTNLFKDRNNYNFVSDVTKISRHRNSIKISDGKR